MGKKMKNALVEAWKEHILGKDVLHGFKEL